MQDVDSGKRAYGGSSGGSSCGGWKGEAGMHAYLCCPAPGTGDGYAAGGANTKGAV